MTVHKTYKMSLTSTIFQALFSFINLPLQQIKIRFVTILIKFLLSLIKLKYSKKSSPVFHQNFKFIITGTSPEISIQFQPPTNLIAHKKCFHRRKNYETKRNIQKHMKNQLRNKKTRLHQTKMFLAFFFFFLFSVSERCRISKTIVGGET
jgi:hypothetical protein